MRWFLIFLTLMTATAAQAEDLTTVLNSIRQEKTLIMRRGHATKFCKEQMAAWPSPSYEQSIREVGQAWTQDPETAYVILDACQTHWVSRYFNPSRLRDLKANEKITSNQLLLPLLKFLRSAGHLREEIRLYVSSDLKKDPQMPPAPFEILHDLASTERELTEAMHREMRESWYVIGMLAGGSSMAVKLYRAILGIGPKVVARASARAAGVNRAAILLAIASAAVAESADAAIWASRHSYLRDHLHQIQTKLLKQPTTDPLLLDQYYKALNSLAYAYSYQVYLRENESIHKNEKAEISPDTLTSACLPQLREFFKARDADPATPIRNFTTHAKCQDAVVVWMEAADMLTARFANDPAARDVADRLIEHAKMVYLSYEESAAYLESLPKCDYTLAPGSLFELICIDPATGGQII